MSDTVIKAELVLSFVEANISKQCQLGQVGTNTLKGDLQRPELSGAEVWWYNMRGKPDPAIQIGVEHKLNTIDGDYVWAFHDIDIL